jgi:ATP-dependent Clp protease ATP-binding subunit ClpB
VLLQILDDGRLTDGQGRTVDFRNSVVILTSNIGSQHIVELGPGEEVEMERRVMEALRAHFKPEFLNRVDDIIFYHQLQADQIGQIASIQLERIRKLLAERRIELEVSAEAMERIAERGFDPHYGARPLKRVIQRKIQDPLAMRLLEGEFPEGSKIVAEIDAAGDGLVFAAR